MTPEEMLAQLRSNLDALIVQRAPHATQIDSIRSAFMSANRAPSEAESAELLAAVTARDGLDEQIADLRGQAEVIERDIAGNAAAAALVTGTPAGGTERTHTVEVTREERTYSADKSARGLSSFFADAFGAQKGNAQARERLERNLAEAIAEGNISERATSTSSFAGLVVPQYLVDQAAVLARAGRPFANSVNRQQLPAQGMSLVIPRGTTGASTAIQATENASVSNTDEVWANLTVPVVTIAGQQDVSRQSLERGTPGIDEIIYADLASDYAVKLDAQVLNGSGSSGQMLGVLNTSGINQATAFGAAATPATYYSKVAGQVNAVQTTRFLPPTAIAMHPRRWNWLVSQFDGNGRPLVVPGAQGPFNTLGTYDLPEDFTSTIPVGTFQGLPVIVDANIPTAVGTGPEDQSLVYRREDLLLWEDGDGAPKQLQFEQTLGNQLTVKLVAYGYAAFTAGRYPGAVGVIGGNAGTAGFGTVAPTF